jgi:hypothetical protein
MLPPLEFYVDAEVAELFLRFQNGVFQKLTLPDVGISCSLQGFTSSIILKYE